jgi:hypothetical protein
MADDSVGFRKPPKKFRFKPGVSGNPRGRPKRKQEAVAQTIKDTLNAAIQYREGGRTKTTTRMELGLKMLIENAKKGNLVAAQLILEVRAQAQRGGDIVTERLEISDWFPDYPGQTAEQKTREHFESAQAEPQQWWKSEPQGRTD